MSYMIQPDFFYFPENRAAFPFARSQARHSQPGRRPLLEQELADLDSKIQGWSQSLAGPNLSGQARQYAEQELNASVERKQQVEPPWR